MTRRDLLKLLLATAAARCASSEDDPLRLAARPAAPTAQGPAGSIDPLGLGDARDGAVYAAPTAATGAPRPLLLLLHGAGGSGKRILTRIQPDVATHGVVILAPDSRGLTWGSLPPGRSAAKLPSSGRARSVSSPLAATAERVCARREHQNASNDARSEQSERAFCFLEEAMSEQVRVAYQGERGAFSEA